MPSSSKHETCQEQRLVDWYKVIYAHLYYARMLNEASIVTSIFAEVLECEKQDLCQTLQADQEVWCKIVAKCKNKTACDNVWYAADYMADTAACLFEFGRKKEGAQFCDWAEDVRELAVQLYEQEQKEKERERFLNSYYRR